MEYIEGDDLAKMLEKRGKPFSVEEVSAWMDQLLEALEYLHNLTPPILHRDIKPQNLKLNEWQKIKLLDFGIARSTDKNSTLSQHTFLAATLNYAPFEQVLRAIAPVFREFILLKHRDKAEKFLEQDTDARCDIFGVGATFYHLLTNQAPVDVTRRALGIWEEGRDELTDPSDINPQIPSSISGWLMKAMAFERENRFKSASEMKEALPNITAVKKERLSIIGLEESGKEEVAITREQDLMHAKTERLIKPTKTEEEVSSPGKHPAPMESEVEIRAADAFMPGQFALTDFNTGFSARATSDNLADQSFSSEKLPIGQPETQNVKITQPQTKRSTRNTRKYILPFVIIGILVFGVSGIGLYAVVSLMNNAPPKENNTSAENRYVSQSPEPTPSVEEKVITTEGTGETNTETTPDTANTETNPNTGIKETQKRPKTVAQPTPAPTTRIIPEQLPRSVPTATPPASDRNPPPKNGVRYVLCYVKSGDGTVNKIRKNSCNECPAKTACELIF
jgi:serine/threonine protein kinase